MSRRKGTPCACECDPCKGKNNIRTINNASPDPNGDLTIRGGAGIEIIQSGDDLVINNSANPNAFVAGNNIELNPSGNDISIDLTDEPVVDGLTINGDLEVNGDIIQNGAAYETHAEKVYSKDDYIIMRDGAIAALPPGDFSGFQVKLYDGVNDGRLVIDGSGTARVGDVGDEQPLLTRDKAADLTDGALLKWDATGFKAINEGTVGSDTKPLKSVNGVLTPVSDDLAKTSDIPTKIVSDYAQRVAYWRMESTNNWRTVYTNSTDNFMVGWIKIQASGSSGNWQFLIGGGSYNETVPLTDGVPVFIPIAIPPHTAFNYISAPFVNGWATLFELKLA